MNYIETKMNKKCLEHLNLHLDLDVHQYTHSDQRK